MIKQIKKVIARLRPALLAQNSDIVFLSATRHGVVRVSLSGDCCSGRLKRFRAILDIEQTLKKLVPGVKIVINVQ